MIVLNNYSMSLNLCKFSLFNGMKKKIVQRLNNEGLYIKYSPVIESSSHGLNCHYLFKKSDTQM